MVDVNKVDNVVIFCGLIGAISWDLITWRLGLPTSSSHALIGGFAGAAVLKAGFEVAYPERVGQDTRFYLDRSTAGLGVRLDHS